MKLDLELHEVTIILKGLDRLPREETEPLIKKIVHEDAEQKLKGGRYGNKILSQLQRQ